MLAKNNAAKTSKSHASYYRETAPCGGVEAGGGEPPLAQTQELLRDKEAQSHSLGVGWRWGAGKGRDGREGEAHTAAVA